MEENRELSIGKYLQSIREERQLSVKELSRRTCIHEKFLVMIEKDDFEELGRGYAKAMTISYARALGADENLVIQKFNRKFQISPPQTKIYHRPRQNKVLIPTSSIYIFLMVILVVVLTLVILNLQKSGKLNFSLRQHLQESNAQKVNLVDKEVKRSVSIYDSLQEDSLIAETQNEARNGKSVKINLEALHDTTDYADKYLFEGKKSPYNVEP